MDENITLTLTGDQTQAITRLIQEKRIENIRNGDKRYNPFWDTLAQEIAVATI